MLPKNVAMITLQSHRPDPTGKKQMHFQPPSVSDETEYSRHQKMYSEDDITLYGLSSDFMDLTDYQRVHGFLTTRRLFIKITNQILLAQQDTSETMALKMKYGPIYELGFL